MMNDVFPSNKLMLVCCCKGRPGRVHRLVSALEARTAGGAASARAGSLLHREGGVRPPPGCVQEGPGEVASVHGPPDQGTLTALRVISS